MRDDFGCVNFAGGEVGHLITFSKSSLEKGTTLLTCFVFGLGKSQGGENVFKEKKKRWNACATFPKTFPRQQHFPVAGSVIILAISEGALRSSIFFRRGSQDLCVDSHMVLPFVCWCPALLCTSISYRSVVQNSEWIPESSARSLYTLALNPPPVCRPLSDVTGMRERGSGCYRLPHMYVCVGGGTDMEICKATCETLVF